MQRFVLSSVLALVLLLPLSEARASAPFAGFKSFFGEHFAKIAGHAKSLEGDARQAWSALSRGMGYLAKRMHDAVRSVGKTGLGIVQQHTRFIRNVLARAAASGKRFGSGLVKWVKAQFVEYTQRAAGYLKAIGASGMGFVRGSQAMAAKFFGFIRGVAAGKQKWADGTFKDTFKGFGQILAAAAQKTVALQKTDKDKVQSAFDATFKGVVQKVKGN